MTIGDRLNLSSILKDEVFDELFLNELKLQLEWVLNDNSEEDRALVNALHTVIAYNSVYGTYMEGAYD